MTIFISTPRVFNFNNKNYMYLNQEFEGNLGVGYNPHDRQRGLYQIIPTKNPASNAHVELKPVILAEKHTNKNGDLTYSRKNFLTGESLFVDKVVFSDMYEATKGAGERLGNIIDGEVEVLSKSIDAKRLLKKLNHMIKGL